MLNARPHKLSDKLGKLLEFHEREAITVADLIEAMGSSSFGLLILLLALPSALPVPAPGYSTPFGVMLAILGFQLAHGRAAPWLPQWAKRIRIKRTLAKRMIGAAARFFGKVEHLIRPRCPWASGRSGLIAAGIIITGMGLLMAIPIPGTNTAPAMVIFLAGVAIAEKDGFLLLAALAAGILAALFYAAILMIVIQFGAGTIAEAKEIIRGWF